MSGHDPQCAASALSEEMLDALGLGCECDLIARVRADERARNREAEGVELHIAVEHAEDVAARLVHVICEQERQVTYWRGETQVYRDGCEANAMAISVVAAERDAELARVTGERDDARRRATEVLMQKIEAEIHHALDNGHMLDWRCQGVALGEVVPAVRVDHLRAAIDGAFRGGAQ